jgi:hypothetical protein
MVNFVVNLTGQIKAINKSSNFGIEKDPGFCLTREGC